MTDRIRYVAPVQSDIRSLTQDELAEVFASWQQPRYRVDQLLNWLHARRAVSWDAMSNLPKALLDKLRAHYSLHALELARKQGARDTTQKFLWRLADGAYVESVLIPANPALFGEASDRHTLCISTQVGCAYGCKFCASGLDGWKRDLTSAEIIDQVYAVERWNQSNAECGARNAEQGAPHIAVRSTRLVDNLVVMGMGEPMANYDNLLRALTILNAPWGGGIGARKITVSTSGLAPQIRRFADEPLQLRLAVSLHGATDEVRSRIMPVNRKYPISVLTEACDYYQKRKGRMITLEYILIAGVNDALEQIQPLGTLARRLHAKVNLIPYNAVEGLEWQRPSEDQCEAFLSALLRQKVNATLRREKGHDIDAACGQLRLKTERELSSASC